VKGTLQFSEKYVWDDVLHTVISAGLAEFQKYFVPDTSIEDKRKVFEHHNNPTDKAILGAYVTLVSLTAI